MLDWVKDLAEASKNSYGSRRMKGALNALIYPVSRQKARKLMQEAGGGCSKLCVNHNQLTS